MEKKTVEITIETPKGSIEKYKYEPEDRSYKLSKILPLGMEFPYDFGFIPGTQGEDGDPLDVLVFSEFKTYPGIRMDCRIIGALKARQSEKGGKARNDRFLAVSTLSTMFQEVRSIEDLPKRKLEELEQFFENYNRAEGKEFRPLGWAKPREALRMIERQR